MLILKAVILFIFSNLLSLCEWYLNNHPLLYFTSQKDFPQTCSLTAYPDLGALCLVSLKWEKKIGSEAAASPSLFKVTTPSPVY